MRLAKLPDELLAGGRHWATPRELAARAGVPVSHVHVAARRWVAAHLAFSPVRGLYVFVPPEFRSWGTLPADWFVDAAMKHLGRRYYVALLTAASRHGSSHHAAQTFQVMVDRRVASRALGRVRLQFLWSSRAGKVPTVPVRTPTGTMLVSTPEATVLDLADRPSDAGGIDAVATAVSELAERLDDERLVGAARLFPRSAVARLGHILDGLHVDAPLDRLERLVARSDAPVLLDPRGPRRGPRDARWRIVVNRQIEVEA
jgi:predicted transcriptional regulator of viral defense system